MRHRTRSLRWPALAVAAVVAAGGGTAYAVSDDGSAGHYRTARAATGDVEQVLTATGSVDAARRADLGFGTSGTVAAVAVAVGDTVTAGQVVARLQTGDLDAAVTRAGAALARARAQLERDEEAQAAAVADASGSPVASTPKASTPTASPDAGSDSDLSDALADLKAQQDAVVTAQSAARAAVAAAKDALAVQTAACADAFQGDAPADDDAASDLPDDAGPTCADALADVQAKQATVSDAQDALADALAALAGTLSKALAAVQSSGASGDTPGNGDADATSGGGTSTPPSTASKTPGTDGASSGEVSAAQLAADQAAIEQARADLVEARQQWRQAVLRSTRSGTVVSLDVARGAAVAAGDVAAVVVGGRAVTIETTVSQSEVDQVEVGERVRVSTPGEPATAEGTVTRIGLVADSSSGTPRYPVTVTVEDPAIPLPTGSRALVGIVVATASDVVTVPPSALTRRGEDTFVRTWNGSTLRNRAVTVGAVGTGEVEVTDGLSAGDEVVLADLDQAITGAADSVNDRGGFGNAPVMRFDKAGPGGPPVTFKSGG